jgi:hypothetical protein
MYGVYISSYPYVTLELARRVPLVEHEFLTLPQHMSPSQFFGGVCVKRRMSLVDQELLTLSEHPSLPPGFSGVRVARILVFCVVFCRSLFVPSSFFFWPLCCLSFFDLRILITRLVFSNSSCSLCSNYLWRCYLLSTKLLSEELLKTHLILSSKDFFVRHQHLAEWYWELYFGSRLTIVSLLCLTMVQYTILYSKDGWGHLFSFEE